MVGGKSAQLLKSAAIQERRDALAGGQLAFGVLLDDAFLAAAQLRLAVHAPQLFELVFHSHPLETFKILVRPNCLGRRPK